MEMDKYNLWQGTTMLVSGSFGSTSPATPTFPACGTNVLLGAVQDGFGQITWQENFAYAEGWDEARQRYMGLKAGERSSVVMDSQAVLIKPAAALRQIEREAGVTGVIRDGAAVPGETRGFTPEPKPGPHADIPQPTPPQRRRFYGTVKLDALHMSSQAGAIGEAIIQHLSGLVGADVEIGLEIHAHLPEGAPENVVRIITENARTLRFSNFGFEDS